MHTLVLLLTLLVVIYLISRFFLEIFIAIVITAAVIGMCVGMAGCTYVAPAPVDDPTTRTVREWVKQCQPETIRYQVILAPEDNSRQGLMVMCVMPGMGNGQ